MAIGKNRFFRQNWIILDKLLYFRRFAPIFFIYFICFYNMNKVSYEDIRWKFFKAYSLRIHFAAGDEKGEKVIEPWGFIKYQAQSAQIVGMAEFPNMVVIHRTIAMSLAHRGWFRISCNVSCHNHCKNKNKTNRYDICNKIEKITWKSIFFTEKCLKKCFGISMNNLLIILRAFNDRMLILEAVSLKQSVTYTNRIRKSCINPLKALIKLLIAATF